MLAKARGFLGTLRSALLAPGWRSPGATAAALVLAAVLPSANATNPPLPAAVQLEVSRDGERFHVTARADMNADPRTAWDTLTDYERLPEFVPGIARVSVLSRAARPAGEQLAIEYAGTFRLLFLSIPTQVWLDVQQQPFTDIRAQLGPARSGAPAPTLKAFDGRYTLAVIGRGERGTMRVRFQYDARFELAAPLPPVIGALFGTAAVRHVLREQFSAMVAEIERRSRQQPGLAPGKAG